MADAAAPRPAAVRGVHVPLTVIVASLLLALAPTAELPVLDDWRAAGPFDAGENPRPKGVLSPRGAEALVAALDAARGGPPVVPAPPGKDGVVETLRRLFRSPVDPAGPAGIAPPEIIEEQAEATRRITVFGFQPLGAHRLLVVEANAIYSEPGGGFVPARIAFLVDGAGKILDAATLSWSDGDACYSQGRTYRVRPGALELTDATVNEGELCAPDDPPTAASSPRGSGSGSRPARAARCASRAAAGSTSPASSSTPPPGSSSCWRTTRSALRASAIARRPERSGPGLPS
jgi:hypothetical protein